MRTAGWLALLAQHCSAALRIGGRTLRVLMGYALATFDESGDPNGIRTRVTPVKGECPRPLDDRVFLEKTPLKRKGRDYGVKEGVLARIFAQFFIFAAKGRWCGRWLLGGWRGRRGRGRPWRLRRTGQREAVRGRLRGRLRRGPGWRPGRRGIGGRGR